MPEFVSLPSAIKGGTFQSTISGNIPETFKEDQPTQVRLYPRIRSAAYQTRYFKKFRGNREISSSSGFEYLKDENEGEGDR